jgi:hypothetical protein
LAIWHFAGSLAFKNHATQAFHRGVMSLVQGLLFVTQQFNGLANTARLINAALFADRQVHRQVQKRIVAIWVHQKHVAKATSTSANSAWYSGCSSIH